MKYPIDVKTVTGYCTVFRMSKTYFPYIVSYKSHKHDKCKIPVTVKRKYERYKNVLQSC